MVLLRKNASCVLEIWYVDFAGRVQMFSVGIEEERENINDITPPQGPQLGYFIDEHNNK